MNKDYLDLSQMEFLPLSEVKATFSEQVKKTQGNARRIAVTSNGRPVAVLTSYEDYLAMAKRAEGGGRPASESVISFADWKKGQARRKRVSASIDSLFDAKSLSRKGQKSYKRGQVNEFNQPVKKRARPSRQN